ncbi:12618_t:CDS:2 [Cetraspora pellucida]|uniref:12618_t:CDS:1 n=1 Tax=Cetraspora pellucida TaxID=1433469 RepID=A0A9N9ATZ4_9GLOM|nr:12618_t:CDS:2 [Cetraspora pellucida]
MSSSKFKASSEIKKRGSYKLQIKAKLSSHLLLKEEDRLRLKYLLDIGAPGVVEMEWDLSQEHNIAIRQSTKTLIVKQCINRSYREKNTTSTSRATVTCYPYVGCLAFASIFLRNDEICGIAGYLEHSEQCLSS